MRSSELALVLALIPSMSALADPISTDRPSLASSSQVVEGRVVQVEQGLDVLAEPAGATVAFPTLFRLGAGHGWEARLEVPLRSEVDGVLVPALSPGVKWRFHSGASTGLALLGHLALGLEGRVEPSLDVALDQDLGGGLGLNATLGSRWPWGALGATLFSAAGLGRALGDELAVYVEGSFALGVESGATSAGVDLGLAYLLTPDVQLDAAAYQGTDGFLVTMGLSVRFGGPGSVLPPSSSQ